MRMGRVVAWCWGWVACVLAAAPVYAQTVMVPFQGRLDSNGAGVTGVQSMRFEIFNTDTNGTALETINQDVTLSSGVFSVLLPVSAATLDVTPLYLQISVGPQGGPLTTLQGRQQLHASATATRAAPDVTFKANSLTVTPVSGPTTIVNQNGVAVGSFVIGPNNIIQAPTLRSVPLLTDNQGLVSGAASWASVGTVCANGRPGCMYVDVPYQCYGGTVHFTVESTGWRAVNGPGELFLILNPDASGAGTNAGALRRYFLAGQHSAFPTFTAVLVPQYACNCGSYPCTNVIRLITRSNASVDNPGTVRVDLNDYVRVHMTEFPYR